MPAEVELAPKCALKCQRLVAAYILWQQCCSNPAKSRPNSRKLAGERKSTMMMEARYLQFILREARYLQFFVLFFLEFVRPSIGKYSRCQWQK
jgi:hypothetical protein